MAMNPFCEIALEEALRLREASVVQEVVIVSIGPEDCKETLRSGLAMGADRAIHVLDLDPNRLAVAKNLENIARNENPGVILLGRQAIDDDANEVGQMLAGFLDWPQGTFASRLEFNMSTDNFLIHREVDDGIQVLGLNKPVVITVDTRLNTPRYASLSNMMQSRKKEVQVIDTKTMISESKIELITVDQAKSTRKGKRLTSLADLQKMLCSEFHMD